MGRSIQKGSVHPRHQNGSADTISNNHPDKILDKDETRRKGYSPKGSAEGVDYEREWEKHDEKLYMIRAAVKDAVVILERISSRDRLNVSWEDLKAIFSNLNLIINALKKGLDDTE